MWFVAWYVGPAQPYPVVFVSMVGLLGLVVLTVISPDIATGWQVDGIGWQSSTVYTYSQVHATAWVGGGG